MLPQQYCLRWKYHHSNLQTMFSQLLDRQAFCDVTLACEGKTIRAHKMVLSACSNYFDQILSEYEEKDPILIMNNVKYVDIKCLVEFMYKGEINVEHIHLATLLKTAEDLRIKGLAEVSWRDDEDSTEQNGDNIVNGAEQNGDDPLLNNSDSINYHPINTINGLNGQQNNNNISDSETSESNKRKRGRPLLDDYDNNNSNRNTPTPPKQNKPEQNKIDKDIQSLNNSDNNITNSRIESPNNRVRDSKSNSPNRTTNNKEDLPEVVAAPQKQSTIRVVSAASLLRNSSPPPLAKIKPQEAIYRQQSSNVSEAGESVTEEHHDWDEEIMPNDVVIQRISTSADYSDSDVKMENDHYLNMSENNLDYGSENEMLMNMNAGGFGQKPPEHNMAAIEAQFPDVIKMNDYLNTGRRPQFWEEPFTRRVMDAIKNKELEMKSAAELLGVSYGTLYGRYRDAYGCLKHPYRIRDFWTEQGPTDIIAKLQRKEITLFRAAEQLNVTPQMLSNYLLAINQDTSLPPYDDTSQPSSIYPCYPPASSELDIDDENSNSLANRNSIFSQQFADSKDGMDEKPVLPNHPDITIIKKGKKLSSESCDNVRPSTSSSFNLPDPDNGEVL